MQPQRYFTTGLNCSDGNDTLIHMTPLGIANNPILAKEFLDSILNYGQLAGEGSSFDEWNTLTTYEKSAVLAWYWPNENYDRGYWLPFASSPDGAAHDRETRKRARALSVERLTSFVDIAAATGHRDVSEVITAMGWRGTIPGPQLAAAMVGSGGLEFRQFLCALTAVGIKYVDPMTVTDDDETTGWVVESPRLLGQQIDRAVNEFESLGLTSNEIRKTTAESKALTLLQLPPGARFNAPDPKATKYRKLFEALVALNSDAVELPIHQLEPGKYGFKIEGRSFPLPNAALTSRDWWSGSSLSTDKGTRGSGRTQVRAWWAAGYGAPLLDFDKKGQLRKVTFQALPGRSAWAENFTPAQRRDQGKYVVPDHGENPILIKTQEAILNTLISNLYEHSTDDSFFFSSAESKPPSAPYNTWLEHQARKLGELSYETHLEKLLYQLGANGEMSRDEIKDFFAGGEATLGQRAEIEKWLPEFLAKARRQKKIKNSSKNRKNPRWVAIISGPTSPN